jgi:cell wall-associated NlpC family hydrolase
MKVSSQDVVRMARHWLDVPFAHQGRSRAGVDCLGLLVMVSAALQLEFNGKPASSLDDSHYSHRPNTVHLWRGLKNALQIVPKNQMQMADILLLNIEDRPQHLAIVSDYPQPDHDAMIHAYAPARKVVEHRLCAEWQQQIAAVFRLPILT